MLEMLGLVLKKSLYSIFRKRSERLLLYFARESFVCEKKSKVSECHLLEYSELGSFFILLKNEKALLLTDQKKLSD